MDDLKNDVKKQETKMSKKCVNASEDRESRMVRKMSEIWSMVGKRAKQNSSRFTNIPEEQ
eukprot:CAMPEP_0114255504 /NCGR_PEP_ID=MMETSP0058-20121206/17597_1 /TAXON_ID=36894 /ORGANISM="Pyramimonas parkeae, CCMP726" /LENGTH=59 /DNA_ID=CAMNT_0001369893 /DNA_START=221 /DNA_END=400 /DNA_ORIENTATION=-